MKIVYVSDSYPPVVNGLSNVVSNLAHHMAEKGHQVKVLTLMRAPGSKPVEVVDGVRVHRFRGFSPLDSYHFASPQLFKELRNDTDLVHVHNFHSVIPLMYHIFAHHKNRQRSVVTPHYHTPGHHLHSRMAWKAYQPLLNRIIPDFDVVHCVSKFEAERIHQDFDVQATVLENGVDEDAQKYDWSPPTETGLKVTCIVRLEKYKRVNLVIEAVKHLQLKGHTVELQVVGTGSEALSLIQQSEKAGIKLSLTNYLPRETLLSLMSRSSCVVNASRFEAYSMVIAEALAMGVPVVTVPPWGINFKEYPRAVITDPQPSSIADGILQTQNFTNTPVKHVPTWGEVAEQMYEKVYLQ
jgi:glycosyltransferase involved in cell wall biosynthesis